MIHHDLHNKSRFLQLEEDRPKARRLVQLRTNLLAAVFQNRLVMKFDIPNTEMHVKKFVSNFAWSPKNLRRKCADQFEP